MHLLALLAMSFLPTAYVIELPGPVYNTLGTAAAYSGPMIFSRLDIAVDKTFVPASIPQMRSTDARELGIRVFRAFVQPKS